MDTTIDSFAGLPDFLRAQERLQFDDFVKGLHILEKYVVKNAYEKNNNAERLQEIKRTCVRWLNQLDAVFLNTVGDGLRFQDDGVNEQKNRKLLQLKETLNNAIRFMDLHRSSKIQPTSPRPLKKRRKVIPTKVRAILQKEIDSKCPFCSNEEVGHFEIHHIDENPANDALSNLLMLCAICHSKITKKDISYDQVVETKLSLSNRAINGRFEKVELEAEFPGGEKVWQQFMLQTISYPAVAVRDNIQGAVVVSFTVDRYGRVSDVKAISGPGELREEAEHVIRKSPRWIPANQNGTLVKSYKKQPVVFRMT